MQSEVVGHGSRNRTSSRSKGRKKSLLRRPGTGKAVAIAMTAATLAYVATGGLLFYQQIGGYAAIPLGATRDEAQYFGGKPSLVRPNGGQEGTDPMSTPDARWVYRAEGDTRILDFRQGRVSQISCAGINCPPALGVRVGQGEMSVLSTVGSPSAELVSRGRKVMRYSDLGYDIVLEHNIVQQIVAFERQAGLAKLAGRFLIWLLP